MTTKFKSLKKQLNSLEKGELIETRLYGKNKGLFKSGLSAPKWLRYFLFSGFMAAFLLYAGARYDAAPEITLNPFQQLQTWASQPSEELLQRMGASMEEMGYTGLTREDLIDLRAQGVTATFTSRMRDLGYTPLTLDELVRLRQNDVSSEFSAMMKELGYELTVDDLVQLRQHGVTAYFTSNMHDLGYPDLTMDELIRLRDTGVQTSDVERLMAESETKPTLEEIIRYRISNQ